MTTAQTIISRARRRLAAASALRGAGRGAALGAAAGVVLVTVDRWLGLDMSLRVHAAIPVAGLVAGALLGFLRGPGRGDVAVRLDRALGLKDRLGTAEAIAHGYRSDEPLARLVQSDADRVAAGVDLRGVTPLRPGRAWSAAIALVACWALGFAFLPPLHEPPSDGPGGESLQVAERARRILDEVDDAVAPLKTGAIEEDVRSDLEMLDRLAEQLAAPGSDEQIAEARDRSAARIDELAERLAAESQRNLEEFDLAAQRFARIEPPAPPASGAPPGKSAPPSELTEFTEALGKGALDQAADAFERLMEAQKDLPPQEQQALAEDLRELARQLDQPDAPDEALRQRREDLERAAQDLERAAQDQEDEAPQNDQSQGQDQDRDQKQQQEQQQQQQEQEQEQEQQQEQEQGQQQTDDQLKRLQEDRRRLQGEQARRDAAAERARQSAEALKRAADQIDGQDQQPQGEGSRKSLPETFSPSMGELLRQIEKLRRSGSEQRDTAEKLREAARKLADTMTPEQKEALRRQWSGLTREQQQEIMRQLGDLAPPPEDTDPEQDPGAQHLPAPTPGPAPDAAEGAPPGSERRGDGTSTSATPEDQRFTGFHDIDLRQGSGGEGDLDLGQWLSGEPNADPATVEERRGTVRRAQAAAERAVERSAVPPRYHRLIQRYFRRLPEATGGTEAPSPPGGGGR